MTFIINPYQFAAAGGYDARAQALFDQIEITEGIALSTTIKDATNAAFLALDGYGLIDLSDNTGASDKIKALYLMIGGAAAAHKYNALRPTDSDAAFRITFAGGWTHNSSGARPNGTTAYGDTHLEPFASLTANDWHISLSSFTNSAVLNEFAMGQGDAAAQYSSSLIARRSTDVTGFDSGSNSAPNRVSTTTTNGAQYFLGSIRASNDREYYINGSSVASSTSSSSNQFASGGYTIYLGAYNQHTVGPAFYSDKGIKFATIGAGLTDTEVSNLASVESTFNTALGR